MSISRQNLSVVIVTLKSEDVVHDCIKSINVDVPIIVVEHSNDHNFKSLEFSTTIIGMFLLIDLMH